MKKRVSAVFTAILLTLALCVPALAANGIMDYVIDTNDLLTYEEWETLEDRAADISQRHGCGVYIITVDDYELYGTGTVTEVTEQIYRDEESDFGIGEDRNGIVLLLSMYERDYALSAYGTYGEYAFSSEALAQLETYFLDNFGEDDWYGGFSDYLSVCDEYLSLADAGEPVQGSPVMGIVIAVVVSCLIALVVCLILKSRMKSVRRKVEAHEYITAEGLTLVDSYDRYTHTTETRRKIESKSSSGGSSRSGKF